MEPCAAVCDVMRFVKCNYGFYCVEPYRARTIASTEKYIIAMIH